MAYVDSSSSAAYKHDSALDDASMRTITASSVQNMNNDRLSQSAYSDRSGSRQSTPDNRSVWFSESQQSEHPTDPSSLCRYDPNNAQPQNISRPQSTTSDRRYDQSAQAQQQTQQQQQQQGQQSPKNSSVVIKVGMVGDAQIGKTSLMVKYVEGSWDEDYIQTLGTLENKTPRFNH